jgi:hypothetical protein
VVVEEAKEDKVNIAKIIVLSFAGISALLATYILSMSTMNHDRETAAFLYILAAMIVGWVVL